MEGATALSHIRPFSVELFPSISSFSLFLPLCLFARLFWCCGIRVYFWVRGARIGLPTDTGLLGSSSIELRKINKITLKCSYTPPLEGRYSRDSLCYGVGARVVYRCGVQLYITAKCPKKMFSSSPRPLWFHFKFDPRASFRSVHKLLSNIIKGRSGKKAGEEPPPAQPRTDHTKPKAWPFAMRSDREEGEWRVARSGCPSARQHAKTTRPLCEK